MRYYVKVTKEVAEVITKAGVPLTMTHDGNCLLYQSEMNDVPGVNLSARAAYAGGALIEEYSALAEIDGSVATPAYCYTPVEYGGEGDTRNKDNGLAHICQTYQRQRAQRIFLLQRNPHLSRIRKIMMNLLLMTCLLNLRYQQIKRKAR